VSANVDEFVAKIQALTAEELLHLSTTPEFGLLMCRLFRLHHVQEWTVQTLEMDAWARENYPCSEQFYEAQVELNRQRASCVGSGQLS
jgi:hypothetical protein